MVQERLLSLRIVYYGHNDVFWECSELVASEAYPARIPGRGPDDEWSLNTAPFDWKISNLSKFETQQDDAETRWHVLVGYYTKFHITKPEDHLPAVRYRSKNE